MDFLKNRLDINPVLQMAKGQINRINHNLETVFRDSL